MDKMDAYNYNRMDELMAAWRARQSRLEMKKLVETITPNQAIRVLESTKRPPDEPYVTFDQAKELEEWYTR